MQTFAYRVESFSDLDLNRSSDDGPVASAQFIDEGGSNFRFFRSVAGVFKTGHIFLDSASDAVQDWSWLSGRRLSTVTDLATESINVSLRWHVRHETSRDEAAIWFVSKLVYWLLQSGPFRWAYPAIVHA